MLKKYTASRICLFMWTMITVGSALSTEGSMMRAQSPNAASPAPVSSSQTPTAATPPSATPSPTAAPTGASTSTPRRRRRRYAPPANTQPSTGDQQTVGPTAQQRTRDAQILAAQKAQSAETARQNTVTTANVVKEREAQQAEPRIQDAPGPGSQPAAGDPAVQPAQPSDSPRIQDAPGPAQTLPQAPPPQPQPPAPQPATPAPAPNDK